MNYYVHWLQQNLFGPVPGRFDIYGPQILIQELSNHYNQVASLNIHSSITHGCLGSMHGIEILKTGKEIHFAHFLNLKIIKRMPS